VVVVSTHVVSQIFSVSFFIIYFLLPVIKWVILASDLLIMVYTLYDVVAQGNIL
jgi:hypothetical protein